MLRNGPVEHFSQGPGYRGGQIETYFEAGETKVKRGKVNWVGILIVNIA